MFILRLSTCQSISLYFLIVLALTVPEGLTTFIFIFAKWPLTSQQSSASWEEHYNAERTPQHTVPCSTSNGCLLILCRLPFTLTVLGLKCVTSYEKRCRLVPDVMRVDVLEKWSGVKIYLHETPWVRPFSFNSSYFRSQKKVTHLEIAFKILVSTI